MQVLFGTVDADMSKSDVAMSMQRDVELSLSALSVRSSKYTSMSRDM